MNRDRPVGAVLLEGSGSGATTPSLSPSLGGWVRSCGRGTERGEARWHKLHSFAPHLLAPAHVPHIRRTVAFDVIRPPHAEYVRATLVKLRHHEAAEIAQQHVVVHGTPIIVIGHHLREQRTWGGRNKPGASLKVSRGRYFGEFDALL